MVRPISAAETRPLRYRLLRPDKAPDDLVYAGDDHPAVLHAGAFDADGRLVGIATVYPEPPPRALHGVMPEAAYERASGFRLRGMATLPEVRGEGYGRELMETVLAYVRDRGGRYLWCNARVVALDFYRALGLETFGDEFDIDPIGPHYVMGRAV